MLIVWLHSLKSFKNKYKGLFCKFCNNPTQNGDTNKSVQKVHKRTNISFQPFKIKCNIQYQNKYYNLYCFSI